jgi:2-(1,2-epoxy-1,2-dihydrophenyl)acetyl-CoA isomerase
MTTYETILYTVADGVGVITLNRPEVYNAFNEQMKKDLNAALKEAEKDGAVRCLVIRGSGTKAFCSGQDLKEHAGAKRSLKESLEKSYNPMVRRIRSMEKPVICMINGVAAGAGCSLALACDMRIMASTAILTTAFARVGFSGDYGGTYFLTQLVGSAKARELYYLSDRVSADEALRLGLTNWVCAPEELEAKTREIALRLARGPTVAYRYMKENLNRAMAGEVDDCLDLEATHHVHCGQTADHREASKAFVEKREPVFQGR